MNEDKQNNHSNAGETPQPQPPSQPQPPQQPEKPEKPEEPSGETTPPPQKPETPTSPPAPVGEACKIEAKPITRADAAAGRPAVSDTVNRRSFIKWLAVGWTAFAAVVAGYGALVLRFLFPNVLFEPKQSFTAGPPDDYPVGEVSERWQAKHNVWIVRDSGKIYALSTVCTHLGCTPNWLESQNKFKCPCHGSGFYKSGINFEGPAPRPLERFRIILSDTGEIIVDKTKKFQQEKGEWDDPESFIVV